MYISVLYWICGTWALIHVYTSLNANFVFVSRLVYLTSIVSMCYVVHTSDISQQTQGRLIADVLYATRWPGTVTRVYWLPSRQHILWQRHYTESFRGTLKGHSLHLCRGKSTVAHCKFTTLSENCLGNTGGWLIGILRCSLRVVDRFVVRPLPRAGHKEVNSKLCLCFGIWLSKLNCQDALEKLRRTKTWS